jgi:D-amino peptidase
VRVYVMTDLEGVAGVTDFEDRTNDTPYRTSHRQRMQRLLTGEVNAAVEGLYGAGATEVIVNDGHGAGYTLDFEQLDPRIQVVHGNDRPTWLPLLDERCAATALVGAHAMASSEPATCYHTMSKGIRMWSVNGVPVGEMGLQALIAGRFGVPLVYVSGEHHACEEIRRLVPGIATTAVKRGLSRASAVSWPPAKARDMIRKEAGAALSRRAQVRPLDLGTPILFRDERVEPTWKPRDAAAGVRVVDAYTREIQASDVLDLLNKIYGYDPAFRGEPLSWSAGRG